MTTVNYWQTNGATDAHGRTWFENRADVERDECGYVVGSAAGVFGDDPDLREIWNMGAPRQYDAVRYYPHPEGE